MAAETKVLAKGDPKSPRDYSFDGKPKLDFVSFSVVESEANDLYVPYLIGPESFIQQVSIKITPTDSPTTAANYPDATIAIGTILPSYDPYAASPTAPTAAAIDRDNIVRTWDLSQPAAWTSSTANKNYWEFTTRTGTRNANAKLSPAITGDTVNVGWFNTSQAKGIPIGLQVRTADVHAFDVSMGFLIGRTVS